MAGLIPLMLQPTSGSSRSSVVFPQSHRLSIKPSALPRLRPGTEQTGSHPQSRESSPPRLRSQSDPKPETQSSPASSQTQTKAFSSPTNTATKNTMATRPQSQPALSFQGALRKSIALQSTEKRLSQQAPSSLSVVPLTRAEWTKAVAEVKRQYINRRYRPCATRCIDILDNIKDSSSVEPAYRIYMHFYAASALEMSARALHSTSVHRVKLLEQARKHYRNAAELIKDEDAAVKRHSRPSSSASTYSTTSTISSLHSPAGSISSLVSASSTRASSPSPSLYSLEERLMKAAEPTVRPKKRVTFSDMPQSFARPDSPTLGMVDSFDSSRVQQAPEPEPEPMALPEPIVLQKQPPPLVEMESSELNIAAAADTLFFHERSVHRYSSTLSSLAAQVASHLGDLDTQLDEEKSDGATALPSPRFGEDDEMRSLELRARVERLRQNGWKRTRFNPQRYMVLCESALAELA